MELSLLLMIKVHLIQLNIILFMPQLQNLVLVIVSLNR